MEIPSWIHLSNSNDLKKYLQTKKCREKTRLAIEEELKIRGEDLTTIKKYEETSYCKTDLKMFRGVVIDNEVFTDEVKKKLKENNLTWNFIEKIHSFVVGLEIGDVKLKNENMMVPELDDLDLAVKLIKSGVEIQSNPHTYIISKEEK